MFRKSRYISTIRYNTIYRYRKRHIDIFDRSRYHYRRRVFW